MRMPLDQRLGGDLKRVTNELMAAKHAAVKPAGLTVPQYAALLVLSEFPGISAAEIARKSQVTPQTMTTILHNLETAGLIVRKPHQWHRNVLETELTDAGKATLDKADERAAAVEQRLAAAFTDKER